MLVNDKINSMVFYLLSAPPQARWFKSFPARQAVTLTDCALSELVL
jgi:hypothetical protein